MSSLAELYVRPIPPAQVAEWARNRQAYEREVRNAKARPFVIARRTYTAAPASAEAKKSIWRICQCGCGGRTKPGALWMPGHMPIKGGWSKGKLAIDRDRAEQIARIPNTELGQLAKKVLLKELAK